MLPLSRFKEVITTYRDQMLSDYNELIMAAELVGSRPNYLLMDEHGFYHAQASGTLEEVIMHLHKQLDKLEKLQTQKDSR